MERFEKWKQRLESAVAWGYLAGIAVASVLYLSSRDHAILKLSLLAGGAGVAVLLLLTVFDAGLRRARRRHESVTS